MAAFISEACHLFAPHSSLFASFPRNEPNDISNNAKINMTMKMFLHFPYIFLFIPLWVCFPAFLLTAPPAPHFLHTDGISPHPLPVNVQRVHMNLRFKFMGRYINTSGCVASCFPSGLHGLQPLPVTEHFCTPPPLHHEEAAKVWGYSEINESISGAERAFMVLLLHKTIYHLCLFMKIGYFVSLFASGYWKPKSIGY